MMTTRFGSDSEPNGARMKKGIAFFLLSILLLCCGGAALAQDMAPITVKKTDTVKGVIVVFILKDAKTLQLQCNDGAPSCAPLKAGKYQMLQLPENHGMYDCKDVQVFAESATDPEKDDKLGEYCMIE